MEKGWRGGLPETICGVGSTLAASENIRGWLPNIITKYSIRSLNDAGAGDQNWISATLFPGGFVYRCYDLFPRNKDVQPLDITTDVMPYADAILCRHVLNHIPDRVEAAIDNFRRSGALYLIATQFDEYDGSKEFTRLDLRTYLGGELDSTDDGGSENCRLAIWPLQNPAS